MSFSHIKKQGFLLFLLLLSAATTQAQQYGDASFYLIDSLELTSLSTKERQLIDSSLHVFHQTKQDTIKAKTINNLVAYLPNENVWSKYNHWLYHFTADQLELNTSEQEQLLFTNIKALTLNNEGFRLRGKSQYKKALPIYLESLAILKSINDTHGQGNVLNNIGAAYKNLGNIPKALEFYEQSLDLKRKSDNKKGEAYTLNNIAVIYRNLGNINKAVHYYLQSLKTLEALNDDKGMAAVYNNMALMYLQQDNIKKAHAYLKKSLHLENNINRKEGIATVHYNLARIYRRKKQYDSAFYHMNQSLDILKAVGNKNELALNRTYLGLLFFDQNQPELARKNLLQGLTLFKASGNIDHEISTYIHLAEIELSQKNISLSYSYALKGMDLAQQLGYPQDIKDAAAILAEIYKQKKQWKKAFDINSLYIAMNDSIRNKALRDSISNQQTKYDLFKKEQEITALKLANLELEKNKEIQQQKLHNNRIILGFISFAFLSLIIITYFIIKNHRRQRHTLKIMQLHRKEISRRNSEKTALLQEIHHRVKNNLQTINSLLNLQSKDIADPDIKLKFKETQKRVVSIATLHDSLYKSENLSQIEVQDHLTRLLNDLIDTYSVENKIQLDMEIAPLYMDAKTLLPLGLIINEIVVNSLKYAFNNQEEGIITLKLNEDDEKNYTLFIGDNGQGKINESGSGFGSKLIKLFTRQIKGSIETHNDHGFYYTITFSGKQ